MNEEVERLAGIEPGDSNEICLAKTMLAIDKVHPPVFDATFEALVIDGTIYAEEVLNARD